MWSFPTVLCWLIFVGSLKLENNCTFYLLAWNCCFDKFFTSLPSNFLFINDQLWFRFLKFKQASLSLWCLFAVDLICFHHFALNIIIIGNKSNFHKSSLNIYSLMIFICSVDCYFSYFLMLSFILPHRTTVNPRILLIFREKSL